MELIWDFDGTLFDTYPLMARSLQRALLDEGKCVPLAEIRAHMAVSMSHTIQTYEREQGLTASTLERYRNYVYQEGMQGAQPFAHVQEICARVVQQGGHNHLCTHRGASAIAYLEAHGLRDLFSVCVTAEDGFPRKPASDGVRHILACSGAPARCFVMIGDRELDVLAGQGAGIRACLYTNGQEGVATHAEYVLKDFANFFDVIKEEKTK